MPRTKTLNATLEEPDISAAPLAEDLAVLTPEAVTARLAEIDWAFTSEQTGFLTHDLHPYPAKYIPQIPYHLVRHLSHPGDQVLDPFGGSGTTALEALRLGRRCVCIDANPIGLLVGRAKTCRLTATESRELRELRRFIQSMAGTTIDHGALLQELAFCIPSIPNRSKWFSDIACAELALIRSRIQTLESTHSQDISSLALSKIILRASHQDSETRYTSKPRDISPGEVLSMFARALGQVIQDIEQTAANIRYGKADFLHADFRTLSENEIGDDAVDLVVTSPPYGNAMDYHLYHRFRMFWLGYDPKELAKVEVGSHLRHQRERNGFAAYQEEMRTCMTQMHRVLRPGAYAAIVIGDSVYEGVSYHGGEMIESLGSDVGFSAITTFQRSIHTTRRSFTKAGRRATTESIVLLRKPDRPQTYNLIPAAYKMWPYENNLAQRELGRLQEAGVKTKRNGAVVALASHRMLLRRLTFHRAVESGTGVQDRTWQGVLENGWHGHAKSRKDPKYVTHGLHAYKGKFYPQLARSLMMIAGAEPGHVVFDPFCGSGTTLLEAHLNGLSAFGIDMNPIAARISRAKVGVLDVDPDLFDEAFEAISDALSTPLRKIPKALDQFDGAAHEEIKSWFAVPVAHKLNWLLRQIRNGSAGVLRDFFEVVVSSIIRNVSQQEPSDLRIRRRKEPLDDADVFGLFGKALREQGERVRAFWKVRGYAPFHFRNACATEGDSRQWDDVASLGVPESGVDYVLTSPPYATALPYIDTDRLSLLILDSKISTERRPIEEGLVGSREIKPANRRDADARIDSGLRNVDVPSSVGDIVIQVRDLMTSRAVGFRRANMPALLLRYFEDMAAVMKSTYRALRPGGHAFLVMGDNKTSNGEVEFDIPTSELVVSIAKHMGYSLKESIPITVTTENRVHIRHAIKENRVLWLRKPD